MFKFLSSGRGLVVSWILFWKVLELCFKTKRFLFWLSSFHPRWRLSSSGCCCMKSMPVHRCLCHLSLLHQTGHIRTTWHETHKATSASIITTDLSHAYKYIVCVMLKWLVNKLSIQVHTAIARLKSTWTPRNRCRMLYNTNDYHQACKIYRWVIGLRTHLAHRWRWTSKSYQLSIGLSVERRHPFALPGKKSIWVPWDVWLSMKHPYTPWVGQCKKHV